MSAACRTSSGVGPPPTLGPAPFPQRFSLPPHSCCPAAASTRPPPLTTHQKGQCIIFTMRVVSLVAQKKALKVQCYIWFGGDVLGGCVPSHIFILLEPFVLSGGCREEMKKRKLISNNFLSSLCLSLYFMCRCEEVLHIWTCWRRL